MKHICFCIYCSLSFWMSLPLKGQPLKSHWCIRAGYLRSTIILKREPITAPVYLTGFHPINSYYVGTAYCRPLSELVALRLEINYQRKGIAIVDPINQNQFVNSYCYLGLVPMISVKPFGQLSISVGTEFNSLIKERSSWANSVPVEWCVIGRLSYQFDQFGLELGTSRALTYHNGTGLIPGVGTQYWFFNQNWQLGLTYALRRLN